MTFLVIFTQPVYLLKSLEEEIAKVRTLNPVTRKRRSMGAGQR